MKEVIIVKDSYQNNTFRITYFEKDAIKNVNVFAINTQTGLPEKIIKEQKYNKHLFCQRLEWVDDESELDTYIEEVRLYWENRINT